MIHQAHSIIKIKDFEQEYVETGELENYFSKTEIDLYLRKDAMQGLAARWAAKDCLINKLHFPIEFNKIEILNDEKGKPYLQSVSKDDIIDFSDYSISLSHTSQFGAAYVIKGIKTLPV
ncbi:MAG: hypothetical protein WCH34_05900 [Bacteroidota bacterium]